MLHFRKKFGTEIPGLKCHILRKNKAPSKGGLGQIGSRLLAVAGDRAHLSRQEMIGRPRAGHEQLAILQLLGGRA